MCRSFLERAIVATAALTFGIKGGSRRQMIQVKNESKDIWVPKIGVPQNGWFIMENPIKMDDLGVPLFLETPISGCTMHLTSTSYVKFEVFSQLSLGQPQLSLHVLACDCFSKISDEMLVKSLAFQLL